MTGKQRMLFGHRDGETYEAAKDEIRLNRQAGLVWSIMLDGRWRTLAEIAELTAQPEASISARLRDFRKLRFGAHRVDRRRRSVGLHEYRLVPNETVLLIYAGAST